MMATAEVFLVVAVIVACIYFAFELARATDYDDDF